MQENDNSEILKNNSSVRVTATAALYKDIKMDNFNLNSLNSQTDIKNCHSSQSSSSSRESDNEFHLIKYSIPLRPKIKQIQYRISNEIIKLQNIFNDLKTQDDELLNKLDISIKENNIQYSSLISSELNGIRKSSRAIWTSKIVLDNLYNEICSVSSFKDLVETL